MCEREKVSTSNYHNRIRKIAPSGKRNKVFYFLLLFFFCVYVCFVALIIFFPCHVVLFVLLVWKYRLSHFSSSISKSRTKKKGDC